MPQIVVAGHVCLDIIPVFRRTAGRLDKLVMPGKLVNMGPAVIAAGGAVANTGMALHRLGMPTRLMGKVGDDVFGRAILDIFRRLDPHLADSMLVDPAVATSYSVVLNPPGVDRCFLHCPGANDTFSADDVRPEALAGMSLFHFGYPPLMRRMFRNGGVELAAMLKTVRGCGVTTSLDMALPDPSSPASQAAWPSILKAVLPQVDIFAPSLEEIMYMMEPTLAADMKRKIAEGVPLGGVAGADVGRVADRLIDMGAAIVMIKLGDQGAYLRVTKSRQRLRSCGRAAPSRATAWAGARCHAPCFEVNVVGTTGAGDCTIAGLLAALAMSLGPDEAVRMAVATGSASVEQADATSGVPSWETLAARVAAGWPQRSSACAIP